LTPGTFSELVESLQRDESIDTPSDEPQTPSLPHPLVDTTLPVNGIPSSNFLSIMLAILDGILGKDGADLTFAESLLGAKVEHKGPVQDEVFLQRIESPETLHSQLVPVQVVGPSEIKQSDCVHEKKPLFSAQPVPTQFDPDGEFKFRLQEFDESGVSQVDEVPTVVQFCIALLLHLQVSESQTQALPLHFVPLGRSNVGGVSLLMQFGLS